MTKLLEKVIKQVSAMPDEQQDALARLILGEIEEERQWASSFAKSSSSLTALADEALAEQKAGQTEELDPEDL